MVFKSLQEKSNQYSLSACYRGYGRLTVLNAREDAKMSKTQFLPSRTNRQQKCATPRRGTFLPPPLSVTTLSWDPPELTKLPSRWPKGHAYSLSCHHTPTSWCQNLVGGGALCKVNPHPRPSLTIREFCLFGTPCPKLWLQQGGATLVKGF